MTLTIAGAPRVKKNSRQLIQNPKTGRYRIVASKAYREWEYGAVLQLRAQWERQAIPQDVMLHAKFLFYLGTKRRVDLSNLYEGPQDALQKAGVIADDWQIVSHDGSRRLYDKENPRVEITLWPAE